jgi:hypothetical protein
MGANGRKPTTNLKEIIGTPMILKLHALLYRLTGYYSNYAKLAEYEHLQTKWDEIEDHLRHPENDMDLDTWVGIEIGTWQVHNGFYTSSGRVFRKIRRKLFTKILAFL